MIQLLLKNKMVLVALLISFTALNSFSVKADTFDTDSSYQVAQSDDETTMDSSDEESMSDEGTTESSDDEVIIEE